MFPLLFSIGATPGADLGELARAWFTELPGRVAPEYWERLLRAVPLDKDLLKVEMPPPWETQTPSGEPFASVTVAARPWRGLRTTVFSPSHLDTVCKRVADTRKRPIYVGLGLGAIDTDGVPIAGGDLSIELHTSEDDPALATFSCFVDTSRPGHRTFDDAATFDRAVSYLHDLCQAHDLDFAGIGDSAYRRHRTFLDAGLRRDTDESIRKARERLRGYAWATVVPHELADRLGGAEALAPTGAFSQVEPLPHGGLWLRATDDINDWDTEAVRRVFTALVPVLPPGRPELSEPHAYDWQLVEEDPADHQ